MTLTRTGTYPLTPDEWKELIALKDAISYDPHTVSPEIMEKFSELLVRNLQERGA
jgi:hypothetical protein